MAMTIGDTTILPGESKRININIARLPSRSPIDICITVSRAKKEGPVLLLMAGLHGDEINGVETIRRMIELGLDQPEAGTVICIPILNIYGFIHFSRYVPDGKDVNRSFPGNRNGSLASRVAYYLMHDIIPRIDFGIDFHTGGAERTNYPQIRCMLDHAGNRELANAFHAPFTLQAPFRSKSLRQSAAKLGKRILVFEGGESARFDQYAITEGINGTRRLMKHLGMISGEVPCPKYENIVIRHTSWIRTKSSGLFQSLVTYGEYVTRNQLVGHITDAFGEFKMPVKSSLNGYIIGLQNNPIVHQGDALMHIGKPELADEASDTYQMYRADRCLLNGMAD